MGEEIGHVLDSTTRLESYNVQDLIDSAIIRLHASSSIDSIALADYRFCRTAIPDQKCSVSGRICSA
jgi:hypothetical protein